MERITCKTEMEMRQVITEKKAKGLLVLAEERHLDGLAVIVGTKEEALATKPPIPIEERFRSIEQAIQVINDRLDSLTGTSK